MVAPCSLVPFLLPGALLLFRFFSCFLSVNIYQVQIYFMFVWYFSVLVCFTDFRCFLFRCSCCSFLLFSAPSPLCQTGREPAAKSGGGRRDGPEHSGQGATKLTPEGGHVSP